MKTRPYAHQSKGLELSKDHEYFAYFTQMGTGKSWMLLADAERAYNANEIECLFLLAPKGVYRNWENKEIPTHLSIPHKIFTWSASITERQAKIFHSDLFRESYKLKIFLLNIEGLISERSANLAVKILESFSTMLCVDESTVIKNAKSHRTKATLKLARLAKMRRILTGSPITRDPYDLYSQLEFLSPKLSGFSDFLNYKHYYAIIEKGYGNSMVMRWNPETKKKEMQRVTFDRVVGFKNLDKLNARIQPFSYRVLKKDCLDLPEKVYITRDVPCTEEQIKAYNTMRDMWVMEVVQGSVTATIALTKSMKMHQILCGWVKNDHGEVIEIPSKRVDTLMEVIEECDDEKIIIWANYRYDIEKIKSSLGTGYVEFHGGIGDSERQLAIERFQNDDTTRYFLGTTRTAGRGITLTKATLEIFYSYDYDLELRQQAEDRAHRIGMQDHLTIVHLKVPNSIDEKILVVHESKANIADQIVDGLKDLNKLVA